MFEESPVTPDSLVPLTLISVFVFHHHFQALVSLIYLMVSANKDGVPGRANRQSKLLYENQISSGYCVARSASTMSSHIVPF